MEKDEVLRQISKKENLEITSNKKIGFNGN